MKKTKRDLYTGKFTKKTYSFSGLYLLIITMLVGMWAKTQNVQAKELISPEPEVIYMGEPILEAEDSANNANAGQANTTTESSPIPSNTPKTQEDEIIEYIYEVFGEDGNDAVKIAKCESRLNPETIGDTHIMSINTETGELVGDSIGIFQVRTGSHNWNRAARNNMTADEFRIYLKEYKNNVDYAKTIYDRRGWSAWHNCAVKEL